MQFKTYQPEKFTQLIDCFWILEHSGEPTEIVTPPSQYLNLSFSIGSVSDWNERSNGLALLEGLSFNSKCSVYFNKTKVVGVRFFPYGLYAFFPELAKSLTNKTISLNSNFGRFIVKDLVREFKQAGSDHEIVDLLTVFLTSLYSKNKNNKIGLVVDAYNFFHCPDEIGSVNDFIQTASSNYTTINRHFTQFTGISTKRMERLVRFRKTLCNLTNTNLSLTQIGYKAGYFDQSHFIKEFNSFMNMKPKEYQKAIAQNCEKGYKFNYNFSLL